MPLFLQWHVQPDGAHFADQWQRFTRWENNPALLQRLVLDVFRAGETSEQGHIAVVECDMQARLPLVRCPGLMLYGTRDPFGYSEKSKRFLDYFSPAQEQTLDDGVFMANEIPEACAAAVRDFVATVKSGPQWGLAHKVWPWHARATTGGIGGRDGALPDVSSARKVDR
jgi:pimeloyl-ACP methyl ester carboxylesterase